MVDWRRQNWRVVFPAGFVNAAGARNADMFDRSLAVPLPHDYYSIDVKKSDFGKWVVRVDARVPGAGSYQAFTREQAALSYLVELETRNPGLSKRCQVWLFPPTSSRKPKAPKQTAKKAKSKQKAAKPER